VRISFSWEESCDKDVSRRIGLAAGIVRSLRKLWEAKGITKSTKVLLYQTLVQSIILYNSIRDLDHEGGTEEEVESI